MIGLVECRSKNVSRETFFSCHQFACHEMQAEIRNRVHILLPVSRREPDIHFFPDRDMLQACSCPLIPISLSEPLAEQPCAKACGCSALCRQSFDCAVCALEEFRTCALEGFRTCYVSRETFWYHNFYKKGFHRPDFVIQ